MSKVKMEEIVDISVHNAVQKYGIDYNLRFLNI